MYFFLFFIHVFVCLFIYSICLFMYLFIYFWLTYWFLHLFLRRLCCQGEKGLLSKILDTLVETPPNASIRFWLSRAIEGFLRGRASFGNQLFLVKRGLLEVSTWCLYSTSIERNTTIVDGMECLKLPKVWTIKELHYHTWWRVYESKIFVFICFTMHDLNFF